MHFKRHRPVVGGKVISGNLADAIGQCRRCLDRLMCPASAWRTISSVSMREGLFVLLANQFRSQPLPWWL